MELKYRIPLSIDGAEILRDEIGALIQAHRKSGIRPILLRVTPYADRVLRQDTTFAECLARIGGEAFASEVSYEVRCDLPSEDIALVSDV